MGSEKMKEIIIKSAWELYRDNLADQRFDSDEDKEVYLRECLEASIYFHKNVDIILKKLYFHVSNEEGVNRNIKNSNNRIDGKLVRRKKKGVR